MQSDQAKIDWRPFGWSIPRLLLVGMVSCLVIILFIFASTSTAGFNPYNTDWDGNNEFREVADANGELTIATNVSQYQQKNPSSTTVFVFAPVTKYTTSEAITVQQFIANGGTLVVADNYGTSANSLLNTIGASTRFDGRILRDNRNNFKSPSTPVVSDTTDHPTVSNIESLTLNYGTAVEPNGAHPLIYSSEYSYLMSDENQTLDYSDELQQYPVATTETIGDGQVIAIGDPSLFINTMIDESDNRQFVTNLVKQRSQTIVDMSHTNSVPPLIQVFLMLKRVPLLAAGALTILIVLLSIVVGEDENKGQSIRKRLVNTIYTAISSNKAATMSATESEQQKADQEALKSRLQKRHPDWEDDKLEAVIAGVISTDQKNIEDE